MPKCLAESELILTAKGRIYHLDLLPEELADTIITVGDPDRVALVTRYFDTIETRVQHRELVTHTGILNGKRLSVVSTGMGTPNIDIVLNELDALVNIDFQTREIKSQLRSLKIIRVGTAGSLQADIPVGSFAATQVAVGLDNLMHFYRYSSTPDELSMQESLRHHLSAECPTPYVVGGSDALLSLFTPKAIPGITITCPGFYGPQDRHLRATSLVSDLQQQLSDWRFNGLRPINFEMETSAMYGLARCLGHEACSLSVLLANRQTGEFVKDIGAAVDDLIQYTLSKLTA